MQTKLSYNWTWLSLFSRMDLCGTQEYDIFANSSGIWPRMLLARDFFNLGILSRVIIQVGRYNNVTAGIPLLQPHRYESFQPRGRVEYQLIKTEDTLKFLCVFISARTPYHFPRRLALVTLLLHTDPTENICSTFLFHSYPHCSLFCLWLLEKLLM